jgi:hypothetical protein
LWFHNPTLSRESAYPSRNGYPRFELFHFFLPYLPPTFIPNGCRPSCRGCRQSPGISTCEAYTERRYSSRSYLFRREDLFGAPRRAHLQVLTIARYQRIKSSHRLDYLRDLSSESTDRTRAHSSSDTYRSRQCTSRASTIHHASVPERTR